MIIEKTCPHCEAEFVVEYDELELDFEPGVDELYCPFCGEAIVDE